MVAETDILCSQSVSVQYYSAKKSTKIETEFFDVSSAAAAAVSPTGITTTSPKSQIFCASDAEISIEICRSESVRIFTIFRFFLNFGSSLLLVLLVIELIIFNIGLQFFFEPR